MDGLRWASSTRWFGLLRKCTLNNVAYSTVLVAYLIDQSHKGGPMRLSMKILPLLTIASLGFAWPAFGAGKKSGGSTSMSNSSGSSKKSADRDFLVSFPIVADHPQARVHLELNIADEAGIALEAAALGQVEELDQKEIEETGNSMKVKGYQASMLISRYSESTRLGGFFWSLGGGYRQYSGEWKKRPEKQETSLRLESADNDGYLHHRVTGSGTLAHARVGYRYVAAEWPLAIGGHVGVRHMNSTIKDTEVKPEEEKELHIQYSETTATEREALKHKMMTTPDITVDFGLIF